MVLEKEMAKWNSRTKYKMRHSKSVARAVFLEQKRPIMQNNSG